MMAFGSWPTTPEPETMSGLPYSDLLRRALLFSHELLREQDPLRLQEMMLRDALELLGATVARLYLPTSEGTWRLEHAVAPTALPMPPIALEMEAALLPRALAAERSLISTHPCLDPTPWP